MDFLWDLLYLCPLLFLAGVLDGIAGGGGIIALPAYLLTGMPVHSAYACNKLQSGLGTACSAAKYIKSGFADIKTALICLPFTILASMGATRLILHLNSQAVKLIIAVCIPLAAILMFAKRRIGGKTLQKAGCLGRDLYVVEGVVAVAQHRSLEHGKTAALHIFLGPEKQISARNIAAFTQLLQFFWGH